MIDGAASGSWLTLVWRLITSCRRAYMSFMSVLFEILAEVAKVGIEAAFKGAVGGSRMQPLDQFRPSHFGEPCGALRIVATTLCTRRICGG